MFIEWVEFKDGIGRYLGNIQDRNREGKSHDDDQDTQGARDQKRIKTFFTRNLARPESDEWKVVTLLFPSRRVSWF